MQTLLTGRAPLFLVAILPILGLFKINLVGDLFISEPIIIIIALFYLADGQWQSKNAVINKIIIIGIAWLLGQIVTDIFASTPIDDRLRGIAKISVFLIDIFVLDKLLISYPAIWMFLCGYGISLIIRPFFDFGADNSITESSGFNLMWKFGIGHGLFVLLAAFILRRTVDDYRKLGFSLAQAALAIGALSLLFNARSLAATLILTAYLLFLFSRESKINDPSRIMFQFIGIIVVAQLAVTAYSWGASTGQFGDEAKMKYEDQYGDSSIDIMDLISGGRTEIVISTKAIADSPWLGHGSWAKDPAYTMLYLDLMREKLNRFEIGNEEEIIRGLIPSHSHLLGAWVESGIVGALFWATLLYLMIVYTLPSALRTGDFLGVLALMFLPIQIWNILFSPFGGHVRLTTAFLIIIFLSVVHRAFVEPKVNG